MFEPPTLLFSPSTGERWLEIKDEDGEPWWYPLHVVGMVTGEIPKDSVKFVPEKVSASCGICTLQSGYWLHIDDKCPGHGDDLDW